METIIVAVLQQDSCRLGTSLDLDTASTLIAVASEDPSNWDDVVAYWPRYQTPAVTEYLDSLPIEVVDFATARAAIEEHDSWVLIDLVAKRILTGRAIEPIGRDQTFTMVMDASDQQPRPLSVHLPPWWELHEQAVPGAVDRDRKNPRSAPRVQRDVLFGEALVVDLAARILDTVESDAWKSSGASEEVRARYPFTIQVHRDWLMTPRPDLGGRMPRQLLHGAHTWIDHLIEAQQLRFHDGGEIVSVPTSVSGYDEAPMGREEMVMYFDLCRELIVAGWDLCASGIRGSQDVPDRDARQRKLAAFLADVRDRWLNEPFEEGSPPRFIIECSRRRVPRGAGVPIVGMDEREPEEHQGDCNCPICNMMADGMFGTVFTGIDGHHLDLDGEFAFSMHETREAWEADQGEFAEMSAAFDRQQAEWESPDQPEPDEFASAWSGLVSDDPIPGDPQGHWKLAFLLAEIVGALQFAKAPRDDIRQLNAYFAEYRRGDTAEQPAAGRRLGQYLEELASRYPELIARAADLQSRIEEQTRSLLS